MEEKIKLIQKQIKEFSKKKVKILAVSKHASLDQLKKLYDLGFSDFGENYVQSWEKKCLKLDQKISWHFIGKIQTNKISKMVGFFSLIHSLDHIKQAEKISQVAKKKNITQDLLVQINIAGEKTKSGCSPDEVFDLCKKVNEMEGICLRGLMVFPPHETDLELKKSYFQRTKKIFDDLKGLNPKFQILSMGTSLDYPLALKEGSNLIRLGSFLFKK